MTIKGAKYSETKTIILHWRLLLMYSCILFYYLFIFNKTIFYIYNCIHTYLYISIHIYMYFLYIKYNFFNKNFNKFYKSFFHF